MSHGDTPDGPQAGAPDREFDLDEAARNVESGLEALGDPDAEGELPSGSLARQAAFFEVAAPDQTRATAREILKLSWPVMLSIGLTQIGAIVDRTMIGNLGGDAQIALAAVGYVHQLFHLLQASLLAVGLACVALMARAIGADSPEQARAAFAASLQVALGVTLVIALAMLWGGRPILELLGAEAAVIEVALPYLFYVIGSTIVLSVCLVIESALRAGKNMRTPMWIALAVTAVKIGANWLLIFGNLGFPRMELTGAGVATATGQLAGLVLFALVVLRAPTGSSLALRLGDWREAARLRADVFRIAMPGVAERLVHNLALLSYFWVLSREYGTLAVAVYAIGVPLLSFTWIPGNGYAQACATLVGHSLGSGQPQAAVRVGWTAAGLAVSTAMVMCVSVAFLRYPLANLFTSDPEVALGLGPFFLALGAAQPFLQLHFTLAGAHRGAGDTWTPLFAALISSFFRVALAVWFGIFLQLPVEWVWGAITADHCVRSIHMTWAYRRGRWLEARTHIVRKRG